MKRLLSSSLFLLLVFCGGCVQGQIITGFGTSQVNPFSLSDFLSPWTGTQSATSVSVSNVSNQSGGIYAPLPNSVSIVGKTSGLSLTGALSGTTPVQNTFQIQLYDTSGNLNSLSYDFTWAGFAGGTQTETASLVASSGSFNGTVGSYGLNLFGASGDTVSFTFGSLTASAIPEPSTLFILTFGLGLIGLVRYRQWLIVRRG